MAINLNKQEDNIEYYYSDGGVQFGPIDIVVLLTKINHESLVWREGIEWTQANKVEELKKFFNETKEISQSEIKEPIKSTQYEINNFEKKIFRAPFSFDGRIRRTEYGISFIIYIISYVLIVGLVKSSSVFGIAYIPLIWFLWAQGAKRCHDRNNSGWYQIIPFYIFWLLFAEGENTQNYYGETSK